MKCRDIIIGNAEKLCSDLSGKMISLPIYPARIFAENPYLNEEINDTN